jgi:Purple acid Phosphatase, N-terminal domain
VLTADKKPLPRFWYFPRGVKAAVIMTGDDHAGGGTSGRFNQFIGASPAGCSVAQWECIRGTSYVYPNSPLTDAQAASFNSQGFEVALHVNTGCADFTPSSLEGFFTDQLIDWADEYPSQPAPVTNRTHCIAWSDWVTHPKVELAHGIRLDGNYYFWPPGWVLNVPGMFTGSGMPMRFADTDGSMIDVYQSTTQMTDESGQTYPFTVNTLLDRAVGATGYYGAFNANMHTDAVNSAGADAIVAAAKARGVPVVTARQMLTWLDGRNASNFEAIEYSGDVLRFRVAVGAGATALRGMLPTTFGGKALKAITRDGGAITFTRDTIKGVEYAFFAASAGSYTASYEADTTAPVISAVNATAAADGTATVTWTTDEGSDSRVDYGTSPTSLTQNVSDAASVTAHSVRLTGLTPGATYHYRVRSADPSGNAATGSVASFRVPLTAFPAATVIETGTARAGNAASLTADDNNYFQVNSTTTGTRTTSWYGSFTGVPTDIGTLRVTYRGRNSASCTQVVAAWRWTDSTWQQLDSRALGNTETTLSDLAPPGAAASYVSPAGEVRVRVRCTRTANFNVSGELLRISAG